MALVKAIEEMERRGYFVLGDLAANLFTGMLAGLAARAMVGGSWNVLLAMVAGMLCGMVIALVVSFAFMPFLGAFEVMLPAMLSGMVAGSSIAMFQVHFPMAVGVAAGVGAIFGLASFAGTYILNAHLHNKG